MLRKKKKTSSDANIITSTPLEEETIENIQAAVNTLRNTTNIQSIQKKNEDSSCSKAKKSKIAIIKPFATKYFEEIITKSGLKLAENGDKHLLNCELMKFETNLRTTLENNVDFPRNAAEFVKGFKNVTKEEEQLMEFLIQNIILNIDEEEQRILPDSVLKLLLNVNCLQEPLFDYILERSTEFAIDDRATWIQMLFKPLMFLENISSDTKLTDGILELLDVAGQLTRQEIITSLPSIVTSLPHDKIVLELVKYQSEDQSLTPTILDCLSFLRLSGTLKEQVHSQMLNILQTTPSPFFFPNLVNFFFSADISHNDINVILGFREGLDWTMLGTQTNIDVSSSQVMTMMAFKTAFTRNKNLSSVWIKVINSIKTAEEHKPLDLVILLVIFSTSSMKETLVEGIFRKRIKASLFKSEILDVLFKKFHPVLKECLNDMLKIAKSLLKTKNEPLIVDFASHWYLVLFKETKSFQKTIVRELLVRDYSENEDTILLSLNILNRIATENFELLEPYSLQIFSLKENMETLSMEAMHHLTDLLAGLAYKVKNSFLDRDIQILIQKNLTSCDMDLKIRGVILGVMSVKYLVFDRSDQEEPPPEKDADTSCSDISKLPTTAKEAATIVELITKSTSRTPNLTCLFYDELSHILRTSKTVDVCFIQWLSSQVTNDLTDIFIIDVDENSPKIVGNVPVSVEYCLNSADEVDGQIALNIAGLCLDDHEKEHSMMILPSLLRLTQLICVKQNDGDLANIDALLGCGVLMPQLNTDDMFHDLDHETIPLVLDCFVYCINWFRELINAFCLQEQQSLRKKVLGRLNGLICLEKKLENCLKNYPLSYKLPICSYEKCIMRTNPVLIKEKVKKVTKKRKSQKSKEVVEENDSSILPATLKTQTNNNHTDAENSPSMKCKLNTKFFREFDIQVLALFREILELDCELDDALQNPVLTFNTHILHLLLEEINIKLLEVLPPKIKKKTYFNKPTKSNFFHDNPMDVIEKCITLMPRICHFMEIIAIDVQSTLDGSDDGRNSFGMLSLKCYKEQLCLSGLFNLLTTIYSWIGFQSSKNIPKLKEGLRVIAARRNPNNKKVNSLKDLVSEACFYFLRFKDHVLLVTIAVNLVGLFKTLLKIYEDKTITKQIVLLALDMLSVSWKDTCGIVERGLIYNQHLDILLSCYFIHPEVDMIKSLASELKIEVQLLSDKNSTLNTFKCISKSNFPLLYRASYGALYEASKSHIAQGLTDRQHIELWQTVASTMNEFMDIVKLKEGENRTNLLTFLKKSIPMFRLFLQHGMPMMELKLKSNPESVAEVLKTLQHTTRFLHSLHCHSKLKKDTAFTAYLPQMKLILETYVYKVKIALTSNNCPEAFWMGNLKNKNLQGEIIPSQSTLSEDVDMEDQLPEEDQSGPSDLDEDMTDPASKTVSKMY